jgi:hypothetical protein
LSVGLHPTATATILNTESRILTVNESQPASTYMRPRPAEVAENIRIRATRLLKSIREDREPPVIQHARRQVPLVVGGLGEADHGGIIPGENGGRNGDRTEGVAEKAANEARLCFLLGLVSGIVHL